MSINKSKVLTPYKRVLTALHGERPDKIPFTIYEKKIPQCSIERELRNKGLCIVYRQPSYKTIYPNVKITELHFTDEKGRRMYRRTYSTPHGDLTELREPAGFTEWGHEHLFKTPDDYKALLFLIKDTKLIENYDDVLHKKEMLGEDFIMRDQIPSEPLQSLISNYMGTETYCFEWMDNRDEIFKLYDAQLDVNRRAYEMVANGPLEIANYGGNVVPMIVGVENFEEYFVPHYNEAADVLNKKGKLIGCHFDADNTTIMEAIASTKLNYIEAYDAGMSPPVKIAKTIFKNKVLWINWPSAWHLESIESIKNKTHQLISEVGDKEGFIIGITEDIPVERWQKNLSAIMEVIEVAK